MNTLSLLIVDVALLWLSVELYTELDETALGVVALGLFMLFMFFTILEFINEVIRNSSGDLEEEVE